MNNKTMETVILAGGRGQRMGDLTSNKQKCLLEIDGEPILGTVIDNLVSACGSVDAKIAVSYLAGDVKEFIDRRFGNNKKIKFSYIPHKYGSGTLGAYRTMISEVRGNFIGLPGDVIAPSKVYSDLLEYHGYNNENNLTLTVTERRDFADSHGLVIGKNGNIEKLLYPIREALTPVNSYRDVNIYMFGSQIMTILNNYPKLTGAFTEFVQFLHLFSEIKLKYYLTKDHVSHFAYPIDLQLPLTI
jgi:NDP-sugar pyrophosphorylase family protein